jgi:hypothetical protein
MAADPCVTVKGEKPEWWKWAYSTTGSLFAEGRGTGATYEDAEENARKRMLERIDAKYGEYGKKGTEYEKYTERRGEVVMENSCKKPTYEVIIYEEILGFGIKPMNIDEIITKMRKDLNLGLRPFVPGMAQIHKGSTIKGVVFIGGEAVLIGSIVVTESMRATYVSKANGTNSSQLKSAYRNDADNMSNIRNILIVGAGALYIWNVIDGFAAKGNNAGQSRVNNADFQIMPYVMPQSAGLNLTLNF